jgi:hypothetical protein
VLLSVVSAGQALEFPMTDIIRIPDNFIGKDDQARLESFGGHEIARGRATRWHWGKDDNGAGVFEVFRGGSHERLVVRISRDRENDQFRAHDAAQRLLAEGPLERVMAVLDTELARMHGELED